MGSVNALPVRSMPTTAPALPGTKTVTICSTFKFQMSIRTPPLPLQEDSGLATDPSRPPRSRLEKSSVPRHPAPPRLQVVDSNALEQLPQDQLMEAYLGPGGGGVRGVPGLAQGE